MASPAELWRILLLRALLLQCAHDRSKPVTIGLPCALVFHDARRFMGDVLAEHAGEQIQRGIDAERDPAAGHQPSPAVHQHGLLYVDLVIRPALSPTVGGEIRDGKIPVIQASIIENLHDRSGLIVIHAALNPCNNSAQTGSARPT